MRTFFGGRQPQNKLILLRTKKNRPVLGLRVDSVRVMVVLVVSTMRLLEAINWVMVPLVKPMVSAGVAMGCGAGGDGAAGDVTGECAAGDADGKGAVGEDTGWW